MMIRDLTVLDLVNTLSAITFRPMEYNDLRRFRGVWTRFAVVGWDKSENAWVIDGKHVCQYTKNGDEYSWEIVTLGKIL